MRVRNKPWAEDYIKQHDGIVVLEPSQNKGKWEQEFQHTNRPIHLEIGSGRGGFIQGMGTKNQIIILSVWNFRRMSSCQRLIA